AQPEHMGILVADDQPHHLGVEITAPRQIAHREHKMAGARDVERRIEVGVRDRRVGHVLICTPLSLTIAPHCLSSRSIISPYCSPDITPGSYDAATSVSWTRPLRFILTISAPKAFIA